MHLFIVFLSPTVSVRLARSESLKAQGEGRRRGGGAGAEFVPRSRSDVDMEDCEEREGPGLRLLHHSASSSASSSSARYTQQAEKSIIYIYIIYTLPFKSVGSKTALLVIKAAKMQGKNNKYYYLKQWFSILIYCQI